MYTYIRPPENPCVVPYRHPFLPQSQRVIYLYSHIHISKKMYMYIHMSSRGSVCGTLHAPVPVTNPISHVHIHMYKYMYNTYIHIEIYISRIWAFRQKSCRVSVCDTLHAPIPATNQIRHPYHMCMYMHIQHIYILICLYLLQSICAWWTSFTDSFHEPNTLCISYVYVYTYTSHVYINMYISPIEYLCVWCTTSSDSCHESNTTSCHVWMYIHIQHMYILICMYFLQSICVWCTTSTNSRHEPNKSSVCDALQAPIHIHIWGGFG